MWRPVVMEPALVSALCPTHKSTAAGNSKGVYEQRTGKAEQELEEGAQPADAASSCPGFTCGMSNAVLFRPEDAPPSSSPIALMVDDSVPSSARFSAAQTIAKNQPELLVNQRCVIRDDRGRRNVQIRAYVPELKSFVAGHPNFGKGLEGTLSVVVLTQEKFLVEPSGLPVATLAAATESVGTFTHECAVCMCTRTRRQMADFCFTSYRVGAHDEDRGEPRHTPQVCESCMKMHVESYLSEGKLAVRCPVEGCGRSLQTRELRQHATPEAYEKLIERLREAEDAHASADAAIAAAQGAAAGLELRMCPACGVLIEKNKGCMTMRCYRCDKHFEWAKAKLPPQNGPGGHRRRWGPALQVDEHGAPKKITLRESASLWLKWFCRRCIVFAKIFSLLVTTFQLCSWIWGLGWRKITWGTELIWTLLLLGGIIYKLILDWRNADPDPHRRRHWPWRERIRRHGRAFRGRITEGLPHDPRRAIEFATAVLPFIPALIKLLWLQRIFFQTDFLHINVKQPPMAAGSLPGGSGGGLPSVLPLPGELVLAADGVGTTVQQQQHLAHVELHSGGMESTQCGHGWVAAQTDNDGSDNNLTDPWLGMGGAVSIAVGLHMLGIITLFFVHRRGDIDVWGPSIAVGLLLGSTLLFTAYV